jgi:hypothetical protein
MQSRRQYISQSSCIRGKLGLQSQGSLSYSLSNGQSQSMRGVTYTGEHMSGRAFLNQVVAFEHVGVHGCPDTAASWSERVTNLGDRHQIVGDAVSLAVRCDLSDALLGDTLRGTVPHLDALQVPGSGVLLVPALVAGPAAILGGVVVQVEEVFADPKGIS